MSKLYTTTQQIHNELARIAKESGKEVKIEDNYGWVIQSDDSYNSSYNEHNIDPKHLIAIEPDQIKQILVAFTEEMGKNPQYESYSEAVFTSDHPFASEMSTLACQLTPETQAKALYQKWCCGFPQSQFEKDPLSVLTELLEILKTL